MKRTLWAVAAIAAGSAFLPASAQSTGNFVDAAQFEIDMKAGGLAVGGASQQRLAQTMTVEVGGNLAGVFLPISCASGKVVVEVRDVGKGDVPGPGVLAVTGARAADLGVPPFRFTYVAMRRPLLLAAGDRISIIVSNPGGECGFAQAPATAAYAGGRGFFEALPNSPGFIPFSDFAGAPDDLPFQLVLD